ncbi:MAG: protein kinase, partial [Gammaproteobacteria bacterium]|nr:protein kinase [Gammaproteobacteria bacterium]
MAESAMATEDHNRKLEQIYNAASESDLGKRAEFVQQASSEDSTLRAEGESVPDSEDQMGSFLDKPALEILAQSFAAQGITEDQQPLLIGKTLGPYAVMSLLGVGGMGEVYAARDTRLGRLVALKILPAYLANDPRLKRRLLQEAKAASALNHHGVVTLYDVGTDDGIDYLVMEYVAGATLEKLIPQGGLELKKALRYAIEITDAVAVAHAAGIIHRDLKPGNIMITETGAVKVLDFGLARLEQHFAATETRSAGTEAGVIAGTAAYMSPEQAQGSPIDARSDIFSFGVVLYEMLTGQHPFRRVDRASTRAAIIEEEPARLRDKRRGISPELEKIALRCLRKDPAQRYQQIGQLKAALEKEVRGPAGKRLGIGVALAACALAVAVSVVLYRAKIPSLPGASEWVRLTDFADSVTQPALSPDGHLLGFIRGASTFFGPGQIYIKSLPNGEPIQLTNDASRKTGPVFSPDASQVAYSVVPAWDTWAVPLLRGEPKLMLPNASGLTWIDNERVLFSEIKRGRHMGIVTAGQNRTDPHDIYVPLQESGMAHRSYISPDHRWVLVVEMDTDSTQIWLPCRLVPFDGGSRGREVGPEHAACTAAAWSPDGRWMYFSANAGQGFHIWR